MTWDTAERDAVLEGVDASRRVAWAKYFDLCRKGSEIFDVLAEGRVAVIRGHHDRAFAAFQVILELISEFEDLPGSDGSGGERLERYMRDYPDGLDRWMPRASRAFWDWELTEPKPHPSMAVGRWMELDARFADERWCGRCDPPRRLADVLIVWQHGPDGFFPDEDPPQHIFFACEDHAPEVRDELRAVRFQILYWVPTRAEAATRVYS